LPAQSFVSFHFLTHRNAKRAEHCGSEVAWFPFNGEMSAVQHFLSATLARHLYPVERSSECALLISRMVEITVVGDMIFQADVSIERSFE